MSEFEENLKIVKKLLKYARIREEYSNCTNLYEFLGIERTATNEQVKSIIREKYKFYHRKQNVTDWEIVAKAFISSRPAIEFILVNNRVEYDQHSEHERKTHNVKELRKQFVSRTRDKKLDPKEKIDLIEEGKELGLTEGEVQKNINKWMKDDKVEEVDATSSTGADSGGTSFGEFLNYYVVLGVPKDAEYAQIKQAYEQAYEETIRWRDTRKIEARRWELNKAWECLKDKDKRDEHDRKIEEPEPEVEKGQPVLKVICERDDYVYKDVRKGEKFTETITIKNTHEGQLKGKIISDAEWLVPERENLKYKHEQDLHITILTSKIPLKKYKVEGNVTIDTNGGKHTLPFTVYLENYEIELLGFKKTYIPLLASFSGFISAFITGPTLWEIAYLTPIPFAFWFKILWIKEKGITNTVEKITQVGIGVLIGWIGGWIIFSIIKAMMNSMPHFTGFLIGAYIAGGLTYLLSRQTFEFTLSRGIDISKHPPMLIHGTTVGLVILAIAIHSGDSRRTFQTSKPITASKQVKITSSAIAEGLSSNKKPIGVSSSFAPGRKTLYYYANYTGAKKNKTVFKIYWYKNASQIAKSLYKSAYSNGYFWSSNRYSFTPGNYTVKLYADGQVVNRTSFNVTSLRKPKPKRAKALHTHPTSPAIPKISISNNSLDFGTVELKTIGKHIVNKSSYKYVTITNSGSANLSIDKITHPKSPFEIAYNYCGKSIKPGKNCKIKVEFTPSDSFQIDDLTSGLIQENTFLSKLQIHTNDKDMTIALSGKGIYKPRKTRNYRKTGRESRPKQNNWEKARESVTYEDNNISPERRR